MRRDDAEAIKMGADLFVARIQIERHRLPVQRYGDTAGSAVAIRIVVQRPVPRPTIRINVGWRGCATTARGPHAFLVNPVRRVKVKPLTAGAFDGCANEVLRRGGVLGVAAAHTVVRVEKANESGAVADAAEKANFTLRMQRL